MAVDRKALVGYYIWSVLRLGEQVVLDMVFVGGAELGVGWVIEPNGEARRNAEDHERGEDSLRWTLALLEPSIAKRYYRVLPP